MKNVKTLFMLFPGWFASIMLIVFTMFWSFWGTAEMYHEGWWGAWYNRLPYLIPILFTLIPALISFRWPFIGGVIITAIGIFAFFFFSSSVSMIGLGITITGLAFIIDSILVRRYSTYDNPALLWRRTWLPFVTVTGVTIIFICISAVNLPVVLTRQNDGNHGEQLINGNDISLIWAPEGPGWNWKQAWGGYPSWQSIALYGVDPVGMKDKYQNKQFAKAEHMDNTNLCLYLSVDGQTLLEQPQNIWRMPTTEEVVRSLGRHGENAGCLWHGEFRKQVRCDILPDKESPLWSTDVPVTYYWTANAYSENEGYFVAYNGMVNAMYKLGGNPRHGYRCVKEP